MEPVDWDALLSNCADDEALMREVLAVFAREATTLLEDTRFAVERRDTDAIHYAAHRLKGALLSLAATPSMEAARDLEIATSPTDIDACFARLDTELTRLLQSVRNRP